MIDQLLRRARWRLLADRLLASLSASGVCFLAFLALLLLVGTQILDFWVPVTLGLVTFGAGLVFLAFRIPRPEQVARLLDERGRLADALATAFHFRERDSPLIHAQRRQAEVIAQGVNLPGMIPFRRPKSSYALVALGLLSAALIGIRYGTQRQLTLRAPLAILPSDLFAMVSGKESDHALSDVRKTNRKEPEGGEMARLGSSTPDSPVEKELPSPVGTAVDSPTPDTKLPGVSTGAENQAKNGDEQTAEEASGAEVGSPKAGVDQPPSSREGAPQGAQAGGKSGGSPDSSSLLSKLRDAMSSLMSKVKSGNQPGQNQQNTQQANGQQPGTQPGAQKAGERDAQSSQGQQEGQESASAEADQMAPGQGAGKSTDQNASAKPGSGMGRQDGSKELREAEQLAAMGKLSEIIGKRSANVTGEMTIESQSGPQQLKTGWTETRAKHGEATADMSRDEVPVDLQPYVEEYFAQVRKQSAKSARAAKSEQ